ncbi:MAG TPA: thioesterase family protein [Pirellulales bacterium]|jgi:4-hydroxybenzoyl-CoA thioesterase/acyl-CoA thioester hydrolase|nr:thioesterase family protein [Pirellulales bacterium]
MSKPFCTTRRVEFRDTDAAGIAHFSAFLFYMESVEHELLRHLGLSVLWSDPDGPISWPRVSVSCDYAGAARFEEVLDVKLRVARLGEKSVTYDFEFTCAGRPIANGRTVSVCCRLLPGAPQSLRIPEPIAERLRQFA